MKQTPDPQDRRTYQADAARLLTRLILPSHGIHDHHAYFNQHTGYELQNSRPAPTANLIIAAVKEGTISHEEAMDLELCSLMASSPNPTSREELVVQTTLQATPADVQKAARRAAILQRALNALSVTPIVITARAKEHTRREAESMNVKLIIFNPNGEYANEA